MMTFCIRPICINTVPKWAEMDDPLSLLLLCNSLIPRPTTIPNVKIEQYSFAWLAHCFKRFPKWDFFFKSINMDVIAISWEKNFRIRGDIYETILDLIAFWNQFGSVLVGKESWISLSKMSYGYHKCLYISSNLEL